MATKFGLGAEIQSPTGLSVYFSVTCSALRAVAGATMTWTVTSYGYVAEYVCKTGYRFIDRQHTTSAVCVDGVWSTAVPDCIRKLLRATLPIVLAVR